MLNKSLLKSALKIISVKHIILNSVYQYSVVQIVIKLSLMSL